ncbi:MAG TPA: type II toxin-antitoxin system ParD family antitoxin [Caulobacteraceae bacterium]|jgi:antitoxin ParD1/3/4
MSNVEKLSVALTSEMARRVRAAVVGGDYASVSEVVRDALREWAERREGGAWMRQAWEDGIASGVSDHYRSAAEIKAAGRARLAKLKA